MQTTPFPEAESPELERYMLYSRLEIVALLEQLRDEGTPVTAYYGRESDFAVTIVLQVKPRFEELVLDGVSDPAAQRRLLAAEHLTFVAFVANIKLQFSAERAEAVACDGRPAFRVRLPDQVLRLQRRDSFRVRTPLTKPATVLVPSAPGSNEYESLRVIDLSVGGMAVLSSPQRFRLEVDSEVENCFLDLPGVGSVPIAMLVRNSRGRQHGDESPQCFGCQFTDLSPQGRLMLQRYVNKVDADQRRVANAPRNVTA
ncbi:MAG TPA: flagellar brake protein [Burkholderiaceae bacterium]|nr:flagellar brake protein [Burkholderiaceae bacterium]